MDRKYAAALLMLLPLFSAQTVFAQYKITTLASSTPNSTPSIVFSGQQGIGADPYGNVYTTAQVGPFPGVVKVNSSTEVRVLGSIAPNSPFPDCGGSALNVGLTDLGGVAVDSSGNFYVAQSGNGPVLRVSGGIATCLDPPNYYGAIGVAADNNGNAWVSVGINGNTVYKLPSSGGHVIVAGNGTAGCSGGKVGDPEGLAVDNAGNLYIADPWCSVIWKVAPSGGITAVAGIPGLGGSTSGFAGDGGPATSANLAQPRSVAVDANGNIYIADWASDRVRRVKDGIIKTIAGNGHSGYTGDGGYALNAELNGPWGIAVSGKNVYFNDPGANNEVIRQLTPIYVPRDFVGNGRSDAAIYDPTLGQEYTALSNGDGTYSYVPNSFSPGFDTLRTGDFNADGKVDMIVYNSQSASAYIGFGNGDGTFNFQSLFWSAGYNIVETGDINGDGKTDVVLYNSTTGTLYTGISNGDGTFSYQYHLVSMGFTFVRLADFTGNGKAGLMLYNSNTGLAFLGIGDGTGNFTFNPLSISAGYNLADIGDLNGDGKADIIFYNVTNGNAATGIGNGSGGFTFTPLVFSPGFTSVRLADYTGDGKADITVYNKNNAAAYFGTGTGTGAFNFQSLFWSPGYDYVVPQDVDADGKTDVVLYNSATGTEYTGISNGNGTFNYTYTYWGIGKMLAQ